MSTFGDIVTSIREHGTPRVRMTIHPTISHVIVWLDSLCGCDTNNRVCVSFDIYIYIHAYT